jgi:hypothetical protein
MGCGCARAHWGAIAAMDFFHVEVLTLQGAGASAQPLRTPSGMMPVCAV